jgi:hypothetical protein
MDAQGSRTYFHTLKRGEQICHIVFHLQGLDQNNFFLHFSAFPLRLCFSHPWKKFMVIESWDIFVGQNDQGRKVQGRNVISRSIWYSRLPFASRFLVMLFQQRTVFTSFWRFCYVVYNSRLFNGFNHCCFWSIIVEITLGNCAHTCTVLASFKVIISYDKNIFTVEPQ